MYHSGCDCHFICYRYTEDLLMAAKQDINKNTANNMNCSLCTKFINILKHKPESETELKCDECSDDNDPVVALCVDCELYLCQDCYKVHSKKSKTHDIVSLRLVAGEEATGQPTRKVIYCPEHQKNELDYYCKTCDKIVCLYCTVRDHVGHTHDIVEKTASEHRNMLRKIITPVEEMSRNLSKAEANIVSTQEKIKEQASEIDQEIDNCYVEQLQELNKHHKQLKKQLRDAVSQKEKALKEQLNDVTSLQDELTGIKEVHEGLEKTPDHKVFSTKKQDVETRIQKVSEQYKNLNTQPVEYDNFEFVPAKSYSFLLGDLFTFANPHTSEVINLPGMAYCGHKVEFKIIAKDSKGKNCTKGGSQVSVQLKSFTGDVTAGEVRDNNDGGYMASFVTKRQVGEAKLSVSINGEQIKGSPYSIVVGRNYQAIDKPSKIVNNNGSMGEPWGVAFGRNGLWAVADYSNHCVYIFDDEDQLVRKFGSNGSNNGQFSNPFGVAFDSHNHLYVVDNGNHRVQKFDTNGNYLLQFGSYGASDGQLNSPDGVTVHNDKVYIADYSNKRISVFQTNGKFCISFGSDQLGCPNDVTVSANNNLLVADYNSCIYTYTLDGHYVGKFGTQGTGRGQLDRPNSLTTDLNGFIIVADTHNHHVSIFDKNGKCIHCFGSNGSANGQFNYPRGIAFSPNGSLYVSDYDNKRIQIFSNY